MNYNREEPEQNVYLSGAGVSTDQTGKTSGLIFKSGDIHVMEKSFADFVTLFYK